MTLKDTLQHTAHDPHFTSLSRINGTHFAINYTDHNYGKQIIKTFSYLTETITQIDSILLATSGLENARNDIKKVNGNNLIYHYIKTGLNSDTGIVSYDGSYNLTNWEETIWGEIIDDYYMDFYVRNDTTVIGIANTGTLTYAKTFDLATYETPAYFTLIDSVRYVANAHATGQIQILKLSSTDYLVSSYDLSSLKTEFNTFTLDGGYNITDNGEGATPIEAGFNSNSLLVNDTTLISVFMSEATTAWAITHDIAKSGGSYIFTMIDSVQYDNN
ncbi:MAG: hypothetical protein KAS32_25730, partial [Candidatus Peribacteraceae bacterium]|nr:hypothetical protein [Candidatus Peribacteraceae bacterium]